MSLQIGPSVVYFRHLVSRHASDMVREIANVKTHKSKPCFQEFAQSKPLQQRLTRQVANRTFVFRRHCGVGRQ